MTRENIQTGILYTWSVGLLITVLFSVMASQISDAFFEGDAIMKSYLQYGSVLIIAVTMLIYLVLEKTHDGDEYKNVYKTKEEAVSHFNNWKEDIEEDNHISDSSMEIFEIDSEKATIKLVMSEYY
jgi:hypothetical protein